MLYVEPALYVTVVSMGLSFWYPLQGKLEPSELRGEVML